MFLFISRSRLLTPRRLIQRQTRNKTRLNTDKALEYFDISYSSVYGVKWPSIRLGLLCKPKYVAVLNNYAYSEEIIKDLNLIGAYDVGERYNKRVNEYLENRQEFSKVKKNDEILDEPIDITSRPSYQKLTDDELSAIDMEEPASPYPNKYKLLTNRPELETTSTETELADVECRTIVPLTATKDSLLGNDTMLPSFMPPSELLGMDDWVEETDAFIAPQSSLESSKEIGLKFQLEKEPFVWPDNLKVYAFHTSIITDFPQVKGCKKTNLCNYYLMGGASLLPVLALNLQVGDRVLDMCAGPGGKSFAILQTLLPELLLSCDVTQERVKRMFDVRNQYIPKKQPDNKMKHLIALKDGLSTPDSDMYDKVLVDVPCINDRVSLEQNESSYFGNPRVRERILLPEVQSDLLVNAIRSVAPGGYVVYSTCTLSPLQNDGTVHLAMTKIWEKTKIECAIVDLSIAFKPLSFLYKLNQNIGLRYGQLVLPTLINNYGPMYVCKIKRLK